VFFIIDIIIFELLNRQEVL